MQIILTQARPVPSPLFDNRNYKILSRRHLRTSKIRASSTLRPTIASNLPLAQSPAGGRSTYKDILKSRTSSLKVPALWIEYHEDKTLNESN